MAARGHPKSIHAIFARAGTYAQPIELQVDSLAVRSNVGQRFRHRAPGRSSALSSARADARRRARSDAPRCADAEGAPSGRGPRRVPGSASPEPSSGRSPIHPTRPVGCLPSCSGTAIATRSTRSPPTTPSCRGPPRLLDRPRHASPTAMWWTSLRPTGPSPRASSPIRSTSTSGSMSAKVAGGPGSHLRRARTYPWTGHWSSPRTVSWWPPSARTAWQGASRASWIRAMRCDPRTGLIDGRAPATRVCPSRRVSSASSRGTPGRRRHEGSPHGTVPTSARHRRGQGEPCPGHGREARRDARSVLREDARAAHPGAPGLVDIAASRKRSSSKRPSSRLDRPPAGPGQGGAGRGAGGPGQRGAVPQGGGPGPGRRTWSPSTSS